MKEKMNIDRPSLIELGGQKLMASFDSRGELMKTWPVARPNTVGEQDADPKVQNSPGLI